MAQFLPQSHTPEVYVPNQTVTSLGLATLSILSTSTFLVLSPSLANIGAQLLFATRVVGH